MRKQTIKPMVLTGGLNQSLNIPSPIQNKEIDSFTFGQWVNYSATSGNINLILLTSGDDDILFRVNPINDSIYGYLVDTSSAITELNTGLSAGGEMFVVMRYDNTQGQGALHFFANGVQVAELLKPSIGNLINTSATDQPFYNADAKFHTRFFYSSALSDDQIKGLYNNGLAISASSLPRYNLGVLESCYTLDSENEVIDLGGGGYHGSLVNSPTFDGSPVDTLHTGLQTQNTLKVDGTQYLTGAKISEVGEDFFFSCFAKFDDLDYLVEQYIFDERSRIALKTRDFGARVQAQFISSTGSYLIQLFNNYQDGELYHFAINVDATSLMFSAYLDGVLVDSLPITDTDKPNGQPRIYSSSYNSNQLKGSLRNIYFGRKAFGQTGVDWFYNKGVPRDLSIMPSTYANEALSIYEPTLLNGGKDISGNGNDCAIVGTPAYTAVEEVQKLSNSLFPSVFYGYDSTSSDHLFATTSDTIGLYDGFCSISFTFSIPSTGINHALIGQNGSGLHWYVRVRADGYLHLYCFPKSGSGSLDYYWATPVTAGQEYDIVVYFGGYDGSNLSLFIDGAEHPNKTLIGGTGSVGNTSEITHNLQVAYTAYQASDSIAKVYNLRKMTGDATAYASELSSLDDSNLPPALQSTLQHSWLLGYGQGSAVNTEIKALVDRVGGVNLQASGTANYTITEKTIK